MNSIKPMLAVSGRIFSSREWIFEPKIDGTRCIAKISKGTVELQNRRLRSITFRYPEILKALKIAAGDCIIDGEMAVFSKGIPNFSSLAVRDQQSQSIRIDYLSRVMPANYIVFDILYRGQENLMNKPLIERKSILNQELKENGLVTIIDYMQENGEAYLKAALKKGLEGVVAKKLTSSYQPGFRSRDWIKIKKGLNVDLVVGGYIPGHGHRKPFFGGLLLGVYNQSELVFMGRVGSGFTLKDLEEISLMFEPSIHPPFLHPPSLLDAKWLKPELVVEVKALEISKRGHLRAPVFSRMRMDKSPQECTIDQLQFIGKGP